MVTRLDSLRPSTPTINTSRVDLQVKPLPAPTPDISLPPRLNRPPTANDLIIKRTFDGLTPSAARDKIMSSLQTPVAAQNQSLVTQTVDQRVRDMQTALNNVFTPNTPNSNFLKSMLPAKLAVVGSMSASNAVVYEVTKPGQPPKYYSRGWGQGTFTEMPKPPVQVVMRAEVTLEPRGIRMDYPAWSNKALSGQLTTITEG